MKKKIVKHSERTKEQHQQNISGTLKDRVEEKAKEADQKSQSQTESFRGQGIIQNRLQQKRVTERR
jgi:hypothetical protein